MKRIMTLGSLIVMLAFFAALGARGNHSGNWQNQHSGNNHHGNQQENNYCNDIREFRGILVRTDDNGRGNGNLSFNINISDNPSAHINYNNYRNGDGFGIVVNKQNGERSVYRFDRKGDRLARQLLSNRWRHKKNLFVEVKGIINHRTRTIEVVSLERVTGNHYWQSNPNNGWGNGGSGHWG